MATRGKVCSRAVLGCTAKARARLLSRATIWAFRILIWATEPPTIAASTVGAIGFMPTGTLRKRATSSTGDLPLAEAVQWCGESMTRREVTRLRALVDGESTSEPVSAAGSSSPADGTGSAG